MKAEIISDEITVSPIAREIGLSLVNIPVRLAAPLSGFLAAGTLPEKLRRGFGLTWTPRRQKAFDLLAQGSRFIVSHSPQFLHTAPSIGLLFEGSTLHKPIECQKLNNRPYNYFQKRIAFITQTWRTHGILFELWRLSGWTRTDPHFLVDPRCNQINISV
jgi:hypothetical protein